jgi:hypothetical protein
MFSLSLTLVCQVPSQQMMRRRPQALLESGMIIVDGYEELRIED